jgi:hypothetical protein
MIGKLDDTLWHQIASTFDHVGTSDSRFFDRYWFAVYAPDGQAAAQFTMAVYNNMNVLDGGFVIVRNGAQHNLRVSRALRPRFQTAVGPLSVAVEEPLERLQILVAPGDHSTGCDLVWQAILPAEEEPPHFERSHGRVIEEYQRFNQIGVVDGWLEVAGERIRVDRWWGGRDHSWGVRRGVGGPDPVTGTSPPPSVDGILFAFLFFSTDALAGHVQFMERGRKRVYLSGLLRERGKAEAPDLVVTNAELSLEFFEGTRRFRDATIEATLADGERVTLRVQPNGYAIAMPGLGYGGWHDGRGLGVFRGEYYEEHEVWDVSHPAEVVYPDGTVDTPVHRIAPVTLSSAGPSRAGTGTGSITLLAIGRLPQYGLES